MASLGQELKRERELRGITLKEISATSKVSLKFLKAIEEDRHDLLPGKFFTKAILRTYSKAIGLDEDFVLNKYYEQMLFHPAGQDQGRKKEEASAEKSGPKKIRLDLIMLGALFILIVLSIIFIARPSKKDAGLQNEVLKTQTVQPEAAPPPQPAEEPRGLNLDLSFRERTWIQLYADGSLVFEGIRASGAKEAARAEREFILHIGNAGGVVYSLNGRQGMPLGRSGEVVKNIRISLDNYQDFLSPQQGEPPGDSNGRD